MLRQVSTVMTHRSCIQKIGGLSEQSHGLLVTLLEDLRLGN